MRVNTETMVQQSCDFVGTPRLNLEEWAALLRSTCGGDHEVIDPNAFAGWMRRVSVYGFPAAAIKIQCGLAAMDHGGNTARSSGRAAMFVSLPRIGTVHCFRSRAGHG